MACMDDFHAVAWKQVNWCDIGLTAKYVNGKKGTFVISCYISKWHSISARYNSKGNKLTKLRMIIAFLFIAFPFFVSLNLSPCLSMSLSLSLSLSSPPSLSRSLSLSTSLLVSNLNTHNPISNNKRATNECKWFRFVPANFLKFHSTKWHNFTCLLIGNLGQHKLIRWKTYSIIRL